MGSLYTLSNHNYQFSSLFSITIFTNILTCFLQKELYRKITPLSKGQLNSVHKEVILIFIKSMTRIE